MACYMYIAHTNREIDAKNNNELRLLLANSNTVTKTTTTTNKQMFTYVCTLRHL